MRRFLPAMLLCFFAVVIAVGGSSIYTSYKIANERDEKIKAAKEGERIKREERERVLSILRNQLLAALNNLAFDLTHETSAYTAHLHFNRLDRFYLIDGGDAIDTKEMDILRRALKATDSIFNNRPFCIPDPNRYGIVSCPNYVLEKISGIDADKIKKMIEAGGDITSSSLLYAFKDMILDKALAAAKSIARQEQTRDKIEPVLTR